MTKFLRFLAVFVLALALVSPASAMTGNSNQPAHYLALGDSLATGVISNNTLGKGYSDFIAEELTSEGLLASYNKGFAYPGYKTTNILKDLEDNVKKPVNFTSSEVVAIVDEVKKADVITLSIGANDVLASVGRGSDGTLTFDLATVSAEIQKTASNVDKILKNISAINPKADVFVMGYYNPYPYVTNYDFYLKLLVTQMDSAIEKVVTSNKMYFVPVSTALASNTAEYMPNPQNIHPSEAGYKAIAEQFAGPVKEYIGLVPLPEIIDTPTVELPTFKDVKAGSEMAELVGKAASLGLMKGYPDGSFKPNGKLTRVQVTSILVRALGLTETKKTPFTDIAKLSADTKKEIEAAYAAGILTSSKALKPNEAISRLEVAQMIDRAYTAVTGKKYVAKTTAPFTDIAKLTAEQKRTITLLYDFKISTGSNGKFMPTSTITRSQAAEMFVTFKQALNN